MLRIGLTGGIASGKTTVAEMFVELGAGLVDTDVISREVVAPGQPALEQIVREFGTRVLLPDGTLDRAAMRKIVFDDAAHRRTLEQIVHPAIRKRSLEQIAEAAGAYVIVAVPLLFEAGFDAHVDRVLVVHCSSEQRTARLIARDGLDLAQAASIMAAQMDDAERLARADDVIDNTGSIGQTQKQVIELHNKYLDLAGHRSTGLEPTN